MSNTTEKLPEEKQKQALF